MSIGIHDLPSQHIIQEIADFRCFVLCNAMMENFGTFFSHFFQQLHFHALWPVKMCQLKILR